MQQPLVSVIVPNYNHAAFLKERMESILNQSYPHYEVIILDDHSTDASLEVIKEYAKHPKVAQVIINETNCGSPFIQWQRGFSLAKGEIIWIAESDDYCEQTMLERLVDTYVKNHCVLAFARSQVVNLKGEKKYIAQRMFKKDEHWDGVHFIKKYLTVGNRIYNASSCIFSKQAALKADKVFMQYKECGDWIFWLEIACQGNVAVVSEPLNYFRRGDETCTSKATLSGQVDIEDYSVMSFLEEKGYLSRYAWFLKCKRIAYRISYEKNRYADDVVKQKVMERWHLSAYYYVLARCSHVFHDLFK